MKYIHQRIQSPLPHSVWLVSEPALWQPLKQEKT